ncbi:MAG: hypothetical protein ACOYD4_06120 [Solirubrobacterales bacterium]
MTDRIDDELVQRVLELKREDVFEAALALRGDGDEEAADGPAAAFLAEVRSDEWRAVVEVEDLARTALVLTALDPGRRGEVEEVLDRVGQKAFILGGAEIVIAAAIGLGVLQTVLSKGRKSEEETTEIVTDENGRREITHRKVVYGLSVPIGKLVGMLSGSSG